MKNKNNHNFIKIKESILSRSINDVYTLKSVFYLDIYFTESIFDLASPFNGRFRDNERAISISI